MGFIEVRHSGSWQGACEDLVSKLKQRGFYKGQVWSIDAHVNDPNGDAILSVHWNGEPSGKILSEKWVVLFHMLSQAT